jgi:hypothetical protein
MTTKQINFCTACKAVICNQRGSRAKLCRDCHRKLRCHDCNQIKEDPAKSRCRRCAANPVARGSYSWGKRDSPEWLEERINYYQKRAEQRLSLFEPS